MLLAAWNRLGREDVLWVITNAGLPHYLLQAGRIDEALRSCRRLWNSSRITPRHMRGLERPMRRSR